MKTFALVIIFLSVFSSCTKDDNDNTTAASDYHGKWTLVKMSGSIQNSETTGSAMSWQEFYLFNIDGTFTKSRTQNAVTTTVSGTYTTHKITEGLHLELTYPNHSEIVGSCYGNLKEELYFNSNNTLSSTWNACDGPGLDYQKLNQ